MARSATHDAEGEMLASARKARMRTQKQLAGPASLSLAALPLHRERRTFPGLSSNPSAAYKRASSAGSDEASASATEAAGADGDELVEEEEVSTNDNAQLHKALGLG